MTKPSNQRRKEVASSIGNVDALPDELLKQLVIPRETDELRSMVIEQIKALGNRATLDTMLIGIWRSHQVVWKRRDLQSLLYRMKSAGQIMVIAKGVYAATASPKSEGASK